MAEKDATARLRRAVKENNLFLVKRLVQRTDIRNPDPAPRRFTSLAWAAVMGHEETFEFLLTAGHDDEELSKDSENNTILMLLADQKPSATSSYSCSTSEDVTGAALRMARLYYDRYPWILDWSNVNGKTALHIASLKGNEELVRMFCDLGADYDLSDNKGNTSLHYASSWGHIPVVQLLIERGCQYAARNNEGFTASDYAYSFSTKDTLQDTARIQFENNKKSRRGVFAQAAERGHEWGSSHPVNLPPQVPPKAQYLTPRMRSGSGTSRTTATSDSGDIDSNGLMPGHQSQSSFSASSSPSQPSTGSASLFHHAISSTYHTPQIPSTSSSTTTFVSPPPAASGSTLNPPVNPASALSPIANRMRERDADAMEKYLRRNRSGSQGTSSTDNRSQNGSNYSSAGPSANGDDISSLNPIPVSGTTTPRRLRPSMSAAQLRTKYDPSAAPSNINGAIHTQPESRHRSGTNPSTRPSPSPLPPLTRSSSTSTSTRPPVSAEHGTSEDGESYIGPPSQYAQFPEPPIPNEDNSTPTAGRRKAFHILSKPPPTPEPTGSSHRRGMSSASVRGA
ncbi:ankyrin repeat-containing domain protein [Collybia nuda]|uniref:Ankyrin repeat-containing domain protein n=1 Tax=Collybia nuda TaxID=64659 RepID=A0A9P5Y959_9AGAR|nr:ankyrin repeat-containing domain protein [Collybia nuda]